MSINPYESPASEARTAPGSPPTTPADDDTDAGVEGPAISVAETMTPRLAAAFLDNGLAFFVTYLLAISISDRYPVLQVLTFLSAYFLYFLAFEALLGRTVGKLLVGLVVIQYDGRPITWRQALVRTLLRLVEVNPVLLGALPAAIAAMASPARQRIGDRLAGTIVVRAWRWRRYKRQSSA